MRSMQLLEVARIAGHVEQRVGGAVGGEALRDSSRAIGGVGGELQGQRLVVGEAGGDQLGQADGVKLAAGDATGQRFARRR